MYKKKNGEGEKKVKAAAEKFYEDLRGLMGEFEKNSEVMTGGSIPYNVMDPKGTAVSILI